MLDLFVYAGLCTVSVTPFLPPTTTHHCSIVTSISISLSLFKYDISFVVCIKFRANCGCAFFERRRERLYLMITNPNPQTTLRTTFHSHTHHTLPQSKPNTLAMIMNQSVKPQSQYKNHNFPVRLCVAVCVWCLWMHVVIEPASSNDDVRDDTRMCMLFVQRCYAG